MSIIVGSSPPIALYAGDSPIVRRYAGDDLIWKKKKRYTVHFQNIVNAKNGSSSSNGITYQKNADGTWRVYGVATSSNSFRNLFSGFEGYLKANHTYYQPKSVISDREGNALHCQSHYYTYKSDDVRLENAISNNTIKKVTIPDGGRLGDGWTRIQGSSSVTLGTYVDFDVYPMLFDLTAMFEDCPEIMPTTIAEFNAFFPNDYYTYTEQPYDVIIEI